MKHGYFGRKLGRNKDERKQLFRVLSRVMFEKGRIKTTFGKAKAVQPMIEKLITSAKRATAGSLREVQKNLADKPSADLLLEMVKTRFAGRNSGYTRIIKLGARKGDAAEVVYLEFVDAAPLVEQKKVEKKSKRTRDTDKKPEVQDAEVIKESKIPKRVVGKPKAARSTVK